MDIRDGEVFKAALAELYISMPKQYLVLIKHLEGAVPTMAAKELGISTNAYFQRLTRAKNAMRRLLRYGAPESPMNGKFPKSVLNGSHPPRTTGGSV